MDDGKTDAPPGSFRKELEELINKHSMERGSDTPDFILAAFLYNCLMAFDRATSDRDFHYDNAYPK